MKTSIKVAAVQNRSEPGAFSDNLESASDFIKQAVVKDAKLIVLPELFAAGYSANESIFSMGELSTGPTITWMKEQSRQYKVFLGGGVPLYDHGHLYNRYYVCDPNGEICGFAQKHNAEAYCFKRDEGAFVIDTSLGRLGVSICADSHYSSVITKLQELDIDILIMPHAWPTMQGGSKDEWDFAATISHSLKVPVIFVNSVGSIQPLQGIMGKLMTPEKFALRGRSCIVDAKGQMVGSLDCEPGILVKEAALGKLSNEKQIIPNYDGWVHPGSGLLRKIIIPLDIWHGKRVYEKNRVKYQKFLSMRLIRFVNQAKNFRLVVSWNGMSVSNETEKLNIKKLMRTHLLRKIIRKKR